MTRRSLRRNLLRAPAPAGVRLWLGRAAGIARQIDKLQYRAVGIMKIGARSVEHSTLPVFLERDLDVMSTQMVECCLVIVVRDGEGMMDTPMIVQHRVYRRGGASHEGGGAGRTQGRP